MSTPLAPQTTLTQPNALYAPLITIGMSIVNGGPVGRITQAILRGATINATTGDLDGRRGQGTIAGISFGFDSSGNVTGLPSDLAADSTLALAIATAWGRHRDRSGQNQRHPEGPLTMQTIYAQQSGNWSDNVGSGTWWNSPSGGSEVNGPTSLGDWDGDIVDLNGRQIHWDADVTWGQNITVQDSAGLAARH